MNSLEPFHEGEVSVQERTGERADAVRRGAMIRSSLSPAAQDFLSDQRAIALGAVDDLGRPWASLWLGTPGFLTCPSAETMRVGHQGLPSHDPLHALVREGREIGTLVIDFASRGRLRVNGLVTVANDAFFEVTVRESFSNCKKYIQQRVQKHEGHAVIDSRHLVERGARLDDPRRRALASVDTCFVASRHPVRGIDASHRGGQPGFVRVLDDRTLRFPDYPGNGMFQTLGNFEVDSRTGVLAVDFERGRLLSLTGSVTVRFGLDEAAHPSGGTGRSWEMDVDEWVDFPMPSGHDFLLIEPSPHNPPAFPTEP